MRTIGLIAFTLCMGGVSPRAVPVETPIATAYSDGFEVIVCEPDAAAGRAKVRRLPLKQAEAKIAKGASGLIKGDPKQAESDLRPNPGSHNGVIVWQWVSGDADRGCGIHQDCSG